MSNWDIPTIASIASPVVGFGVLYLTISSEGRKRRREDQKDAQERTDAIMSEVRDGRKTSDDRLKEVEVKIRDFMPRVEIEAKIDHEKNNRVTSDQALSRQIESNTRDIVEIKVGVGQLGQKQDGLSDAVGEIKTLIKDGQRDVNAKFDRLFDTGKKAA